MGVPHPLSYICSLGWKLFTKTFFNVQNAYVHKTNFWSPSRWSNYVVYFTLLILRIQNSLGKQVENLSCTSLHLSYIVIVHSRIVELSICLFLLHSHPNLSQYCICFKKKLDKSGERPILHRHIKKYFLREQTFVNRQIKIHSQEEA